MMITRARTALVAALTAAAACADMSGPGSDILAGCEIPGATFGALQHDPGGDVAGMVRWLKSGM